MMFSLSKLSEKKRKVFLNIFWAALGKIVNMFSALFVGILVARYLGPKNYGIMNYVNSYVALFSVISSFGLDNIEIRELSKNHDNRNDILGTCIVTRLLLSVLTIFLINLSLLFFDTDSFTAKMIFFYSFTLIPSSFNVVRNYFTSIVKNREVVKTEILRTLIFAIVKILLLWYKSPLSYFIYCSIFEVLFISTGYIVSYQKTIDDFKNWTFNKALIPYFLKESFPLLLSGAAVIVYQKIDHVMIGTMIDKESVGYFSTACKFVGLILFIPQVLTQTITPLLIKIKESGNNKLYEERKYQFVSIVVWISIILSLFISLSASFLIHYTYGDKYLMAVPVLQIIAWKTVGSALSSSAGQLIIIEGNQKWAVIRNTLGCIVCVFFNLLLIPKYGIIGSAWVTLLTFATSSCLGNIFIPSYHKYLKLELKSLFLGWKNLIYIKKILG